MRPAAPPAPYSREAALALTLGQLVDRWVHVTCSGCTYSVFTPCRLLAQKLGKRTKLGDIVPRLRCTHCKSKPRSVELCEDAGGGSEDRVPPWRIALG